MKPKVLISAPYMLRKEELIKIKPELDGLPIDYDLAQVHERLEENKLMEIIGQYHGVICGDDRFTKKVYNAAKNLKVIVKWGTGVDSLNFEYAISKGIKTFRTPNAFTIPVADTTLGYMLNHVRNIYNNDFILKSGGWDKPQGFTLAEKKIGLIGFGNIGRAVAQRLKGFGCEVWVYDIQDFPTQDYEKFSVKKKSFQEIIQFCDIISLHCELNEKNHHLINREVLQSFSQSPFLVNTARGPLIDEGALVEALESGKVAGAGMDVFEEEPLPLESPLRKMKQVFLASHNSNSSPLSWKNVHINSIRMLKEGLGL